MNTTTMVPLREDDRYGTAGINTGSAVSWGAIFAGAAAAASLSLILLILGVGLGLSSVSPWSTAGVSAEAFGVSTILWITFTSIAASGVGGYLAGRLRARWTLTHADEVYFRDTAHGFLAWGVASIATAALLTSAVGSIVSGGAQTAATAGGAVATTAAATAAAAGPQMAQGTSQQATSYFVDSLFRKDASAAAGSAGAAGAAAVPASPATTDMSQGPVPSAEVGRIFASGLRGGAALPPDDVRYVGQLVAQRTGMAQADAEKRVTDNYSKLQAQIRDAETKAKDAADKARKTSAYAALWIFVSLLAGAFVASFLATVGGRQRDV